ncbi:MULTISPECIES: ABC transporter permease [unclassified Fusibacter]|uniref:ABC transporter permease n=1 Tax=unclassified Fusibacter TaxID=2624464 RepID=UPI001011E2CB|nr:MULTISPECIES: ABC transporter permease [unclassified Fusibacter]MCK8058721.1 ABC transporter permease [Fusibacter sp. A2]NPE21795.1 ABC transporter permease [Fusibacter sp. A1]RXV61367.1 ABC transporter permease [Fusibacter sp. A1]
MKLWYSFAKELSLSSKSWYFYIELGMAVVILLILIFVVPEEFDAKGKEYFYLDLPQVVTDRFTKDLLDEDLDETVEQVEVEADKQMFSASLYETEESKIYLLDSMEALDAFSNAERVIGIHVHVNEENQIVFTYYLQGYETQKLQNLLLVYHNRLAGHDVIEEYSDNIAVRRLYQDIEPLSDRQNMIPVFLTFNGSLMSLFIIAAYIFLDKNEGIIKAYAITASSVWHYLLSKIGVIIVTSIVTSLIITVPLMGLQPNYLMMLLFILCSGIFAASLGLFLTSFYKDIVEAFGAMYIVIMIMIMPNISYFTPSWDPDWVKIIPSYVMLQSFKELISVGGNMTYVAVASLGFAVLGLDIFILATYRFKRTMAL